jgi:two-component system cell cycle sensor histidine kinase/response regulator CckA
MAHQHVTNDYMAHGYCFSWEPGLVWLHVVSDVITGIAYYSIPVALFYVAYRRRDLPFYRMFLLFAVFILSCGTTHFFAAYTVFDPEYWLEGYVKAFTAIVSAISAVLFIPLLPKVIALPSLSKALQDNEELNSRLQKKVEELQATAQHLVTANHELQLSESRFRRAKEFTDKVIQSANVLIVGLDASGEVTLLNRTAEELLGYSREEIEQNGFRTFIPQEVLPAVQAEFVRLMGGGKSDTFENPIITKSGERRTISWRNSPITENGDVVGTISFGIDVTEHRKTEAQLIHAQKMEAIGTLAGGIAHDFNNILTTITGFGTLLTMNMAKDDPNRVKAEKILTAADRAAALTQGLLAYSRKEAVDLHPVDLNEIITKFDHFLSKIIGEDVELKIFPGEGELTILADIGQIEQVLMNLAVNARDAMPGGGSLLLRTEETEIDAGFVATHGYGKEGRYAIITVSDTGAGMDTVTLEHIFEPFFTTKEVGKGTGLGLAIVYGIIKQHQGFINAYSEQGKGTTFRIYLPLTGLSPEIAHHEPSTVVRGNGETVLLVEDNDEIRGFFRDLLNDNGYQVIEAVDGEEAVETFRLHRDQIRLLLLDIIMPRKNGKETYDEIHIIEPGVNALFMSGYTADIINRKGIDTEGLELISKPFSPLALLAKIREVLDRP